MYWGMIGTQTVLIVPIVYSDLDGHRRIYQANDGGGYPNEIGIASIDCACEAVVQSR